MQVTSRRRQLAFALVLALLWSTALTAVAPPVAHAVTTRPAPDDPLPTCRVVDGREVGACEGADRVAVAANGRLGTPGARVALQVSPGIPACSSWPDRVAWNPDPCFVGVGYSFGAPVTLSEDRTDLVPARPLVAAPGSYTVEQSSTTYRLANGETRPSRACGSARPDFDFYVYGGHKTNAPWATFSKYALECELIWEGDRPDNLAGATWIPVSVSLTLRSNGDLPPAPTARTWVRVEGDMPNPGPEAAFTIAPSQGLQHQATDASTHPWDLPLTHEWFVDGTSVSTAASPLLDLEPGDNTVSLVVTDSDGLEDRATQTVRVADGALDVSIGRTDTEPLLAGDTFDVVVRVALPFDAPEDVLGVAPTGGGVLQLPPWLEVVTGAMETGFDLTPGSERSATYTLRALGPGAGEVVTAWSGTTSEGLVAGRGTVPVRAEGTMDGEWFRTDLLGTYVREGETTPVRLRIENLTGQDLTGVRLVSAEVHGAAQEGGGDGGGDGVIIPGGDGQEPGGPLGDATLAGPSNALRGTLGTGPASVDFLDFQLTGVAAGPFELRAAFEGTTADGTLVQGFADAQWEVRDVAMQVQVVLPDTPVMLEPREDGERDETGTLVDPGFEPAVVPVTLRVSVAEGDDPVNDVQPFEVVDGDAGLDVDVVARVAGAWAELAEQPVPFPVTWSSATPASVPEVAPGTSVDFTVDLTVTRPGAFQIVSLVEGVVGDTGVRARGESVLEVGGDEILLVSVHADRDQGNPPRIEEGGTAHFTGTVQNLSLTDTIDLAPVRVAGLGQGLVVGPVELSEQFPEAGSFGIFGPELEPGQRTTFKIKVETVSLPGLEWEPLVTGRESVLIDLVVGGTVTDVDGVERDLARTQINYEIGNGRHETEDAEVVRVEVDPRLEPFPPVTFQQVFVRGFGGVVDGVLGGAQDFGVALVGIPQLIAALPSVLWTVGEAGFDTTTYLGQYALTASRYAWAWYDYQLDVWLELPAEEHRRLRDQISDELAALHEIPVEQVKPIVDGAVQGMFEGLIGWYDEVDRAGRTGNIDALVEHTITATRVTTRTLAEEISGQALLSFMARSHRYFRGPLDDAQARADVDGPAEVDAGTSEMAASGRDPRVSEGTTPRQGFRAGTAVTPLQAVRGWAIDAVSDANLRRLTSAPDGLPIVVAIRSRADETLEWMRTTIGITPKPVTVKAKNVNQWDVEYLGYRDGVGYRTGPDGRTTSVGDRGSVALVEPLPREEVIARLRAANADDYTFEQVLERHDGRWEEWYGVECPRGNATCVVPDPPQPSDFSKLTDGAVRVVNPDGTITYKGSLDVPRKGSPPEPKDNFDTAYPEGHPQFDGQFDPQPFELRGVRTEDGREYYEMWLTDTDGVLKRVSGDVDVVSVTRTDGRSLRPQSDFARYVSLELQDAVRAQHPWSTSLSNPELRKKFVDAHRWHPDPRKRGEPLLVYVKGEARVGWFDQNRFVPLDEATSEVHWLQGGPEEMAAVVEQQHRLRNEVVDPFTTPGPATRPADRQVRKELIDADAAAGTTHFATCSITTSRTAAVVYRMGTRFEERQDDGTWKPADPAAACEAGGQITLVPETLSLTELSPGDTVIEILEALLPFDWREMFLPGDCVTISPGQQNEERACIREQGSLVLTAPLRNSHPLGARIVLDPAVHAPPPRDVCDSPVRDALVARSGDTGPDRRRRDHDITIALLDASTVDCRIADHDGPLTLLAPRDLGWLWWARARGFDGVGDAAVLAFVLDHLVVGGDTSALDDLLAGHVMLGAHPSSELRGRQRIPTLDEGRALDWRRRRILDRDRGTPDPRVSHPRNLHAGDDVVHTVTRVVPVG